MGGSLQVDEIDVRILDQLQIDGRMSFARIAKNVGVAESTVRARVGRLRRRKLVRFVADLDPNDLGLVYVYVGFRVQGAALKRVLGTIEATPEIIYAVLTSGSFDVLSELVCRDNDDLLRLLEELRHVPGVAHMETLTVLRIAKDEWRYAALLLADR